MHLARTAFMTGSFWSSLPISIFSICSQSGVLASPPLCILGSCANAGSAIAMLKITTTRSFIRFPKSHSCANARPRYCNSAATIFFSRFVSRSIIAISCYIFCLKSMRQTRIDFYCRFREARKKARRHRRPTPMLLAKFRLSHGFFFNPKAYVHDGQHRKHQECWQRRQLQEETKHNGNEGHVLWMSNISIYARGGQTMVALCLPQRMPGVRQRDKPTENKYVAQDMEKVPMRIAIHTEQRVNQMAVVVC